MPYSLVLFVLKIENNVGGDWEMIKQKPVLYVRRSKILSNLIHKVAMEIKEYFIRLQLWEFQY